jgi:hypothetical protein
MMHLEGTTFIKPIDGYRFYAGPEHTQDLTESDIREVMQNWRQYAIANPVHHFDLAIGAAYLEAWLDGREYCGVYDRLLGAIHA